MMDHRKIMKKKVLWQELTHEKPYKSQKGWRIRQPVKFFFSLCIFDKIHSENVEFGSLCDPLSLIAIFVFRSSCDNENCSLL